MRYIIAKKNDIVHYAQLEANQDFATAMPVSEYNSFDEWITALQNAGVDTSEIERQTPQGNAGDFIVTQKQISTDGVETAVCKYSTTEPVTYYVDDGEITPIIVEPVDGWAVLEISAISAGRIDVFIQEHSTTIFAL